MANNENPYISRDNNGVLVITGTHTKLRTLVMDYVGYGWNAEEIQEQRPYLTLRHIHAALAYYHDHQVEMDAEVAEDLRHAERTLEQIERLQDNSPLDAKLRAKGRRP